MKLAAPPIPQRTNLALAGLVLVTALAMLWLGSRLPLPGMLAIGFLFSYLLLTNYALLHEATHDMLHSNRRINWLVGMVLGWQFILFEHGFTRQVIARLATLPRVRAQPDVLA